MASNYGLGVTALNIELDDIRDVKINANTKIGRNHNKDYVLRYKNDGSHFVMVPAAVQQHEHPAANLAELGDVDTVSLGATAAANDATPFGFSWDRSASKFLPYNIPRNLDEVLDGTVRAGTAGIPQVLFYHSNENKYKLQDLRHYLPHENSDVKLIRIPLHLKITPTTVIMKAGNELKKWINSGEWYVVYSATGATGGSNIGLFWDTQLNVLGLKAGVDEGALTMQAASRAMTDHLKILRKGTLFIKCIKLSTEGEYDELVDGISIQASEQTKCAIIINIDEVRRNLEIRFVGEENVANNLRAVIGEENKDNLDISTIKLKRFILLDLKYFTEILSNEDITNLI